MYKQITGQYRFGPVTLIVDRVQVDPFASPSKVRVRVDRADAGFPADLTTTRLDRVAASDYLLRVGNAVIRRHHGRAINLGHPGQEVLERTNVIIDDAGFEARLLVNLPARGRRILGHQAADTVTGDVIDLARAMFLYADIDGDACGPTSSCCATRRSCRTASARRICSGSSATVRSYPAVPAIRIGRWTPRRPCRSAVRRASSALSTWRAAAASRAWRSPAASPSSSAATTQVDDSARA